MAIRKFVSRAISEIANNLILMALDHLKVDTEPKKLLVLCEPYVVYAYRGYQAVIDVIESRTKREYRLFIGAKTLSRQLNKLVSENNSRFTGLEFWIRKADGSPRSVYILE